MKLEGVEVDEEERITDPELLSEVTFPPNIVVEVSYFVVGFFCYPRISIYLQSFFTELPILSYALLSFS